jgi:hypothetical protein
MVRERAIGHTIASYNLFVHCFADIFQSITLHIHVPFMEYDLQTPCP